MPPASSTRDAYLLAWGLWQSAARFAPAQQVRPFRELEALGRLDRGQVDRSAEALLARLLETVWARGWQPAEVLRQCRLQSRGALPRQLVALAIAADHARRPPDDLDPRWRRQLSEIDLPGEDPARGWLPRWRAAGDHQRREIDEALVSAMALLTHLPPVETLMPPPGERGPDATPSRVAASAHPVLQRIRALLNKAESTEFEAEAEALTEKAQELMTRHAVDEAMLRGTTVDTDEPDTIRVAIDAPYADVKSLLLQTIAGASRCSTAYSPSLALSTVIGFPTDLEAVEMLYTSLLVQAQRALSEVGHGARAGDRARSQSFRSAFLLSFTLRIGKRLAQANALVFEQSAADSGRFLPVLRSRQQRVDEAVRKRLGSLEQGVVRAGHDPAGWVQGAIAGDAARLASADLPGAGPG